MDDQAVRLSVCTPTYQGLRRLEITAPRVLEVLGPDDEIIYSLDGSTDGSEEFLRALALKDLRIVLEVGERNRGRTEALNSACRRARGQIVLRLDDDIVVPDRFFDLHVSEHERFSQPVGVVQPLIDVFDDDPRSHMWRAFVTRNAQLDRERFEANPKGLPACVWGPVCSVRRVVGEQLGWYDESFNADGWEDVEFGYRLRQSGVRLVSLDTAAVQHRVHWTSFKRKLERGFDSGARMAVFAQIHGSAAVLEALGSDSEDFETPQRVETGRYSRSRPAFPGLRVLVSAGIERILAFTRWRRGYDWWVARRLTWAYASGWYAELARVGLPCIEPPTQWLIGSSSTAISAWKRTCVAWDRQTDVLRPYSYSVLRSAWLRHLEAKRIPWVRGLRGAVGSAMHLLDLARPRRREALTLVEAVKGNDAWVFVEAATPSQGDGALAIAHTLKAAGHACIVVTSTPKTARWIAKQYPGRTAHSLDSVAGLRAGSTLRSIMTARKAARGLVEGAKLDATVFGTVQLECEAAGGALLAQGIDALTDLVLPRLVISTSEYFAASIALRTAMQSKGVRFVTLQHGAINAVYAPFYADEYWVWNSRSREALRNLQPSGSIMVVGNPREHVVCTGDRSSIRARFGVDDAFTPVVVFFSQTHGFEYSAATHFAVAAQIARLRQLVPESVVIIKRHPSERCSMLETLCNRDERVRVAPVGLSSTDVAIAADVAIALNSTALVDAATVGCCAVELICPESIVVEPVAAERVSINGAADRLEILLTSPGSYAKLLEAQREWLKCGETPEASFGAAILDSALELMGFAGQGSFVSQEGFGLADRSNGVEAS